MNFEVKEKQAKLEGKIVLWETISEILPFESVKWMINK